MLITEAHFTNKRYFSIVRCSVYDTNYPDGTAHGGSCTLKHFTLSLNGATKKGRVLDVVGFCVIKGINISTKPDLRMNPVYFYVQPIHRLYCVFSQD